MTPQTLDSLKIKADSVTIYWQFQKQTLTSTFEMGLFNLNDLKKNNFQSVIFSFHKDVLKTARDRLGQKPNSYDLEKIVNKK